MTSTVVARVKSILAVLLIIALVMIGQKWNITVYTFGVLLILSVVVVGFTFNNISESRPARFLVVPLVVTWVIVGAMFVLSYFLAPLLAQIGG